LCHPYYPSVKDPRTSRVLRLLARHHLEGGPEEGPPQRPRSTQWGGCRPGTASDPRSGTGVGSRWAPLQPRARPSGSSSLRAPRSLRWSFFPGIPAGSAVAIAEKSPSFPAEWARGVKRERRSRPADPSRSSRPITLQHQVAASGRFFEGSPPLSARRIGPGHKTGPRPADDLPHRPPMLDRLNRGWIKGIAARAPPSFGLQSVRFGDGGSPSRCAAIVLEEILSHR
jgi:hypothetical protein